MSPTEKLGRDHVFHILRSPVRRGIIRILGEKGQLSFTDLRKTFPEISVGTLYYHLDLLNQIVTQNSQKKYILTEEGKKILAQVLRSEEAMIPVKASVESQSKAESATSFLLMSGLFSDISLRPIKYIAVPFLIFLSLALLAWLSHSIQLLFFFIPVNGTQTILASISAGASLLGAYSILNVLTLLFYRRREGNLSLLIATSIGFIPLSAYPIALIVAAFTNSQAAFARSSLNILLTIIPQVISVLLISTGLSQAKGLRLDKSALIALVVVYLNMILLYFLGYIQV
jgi:DNA-binding PadR family transcriptional regulator